MQEERQEHTEKQGLVEQQCQTGKQKQMEELAGRVLRLSRDMILVNLRFMDSALAGLQPQVRYDISGAATDGTRFYYHPAFVLRLYDRAPEELSRLYLHSLLHCIFFHSFAYDKVERELWDLAADIAVETVISELAVHGFVLESDERLNRKLQVLREDAGGLTAEKIYRYLRTHYVSDEEKEEWRHLCFRDSHDLWIPREELAVSENDWKKISERLKAELKSFSKKKAGAESLEKNLEEATRDRYDYSEILSRFTVMGEDMTVNDEEFDYIYYTYGLARYGNLPLVEPLEYREAKKVREFVVALDTSASCRGPILRGFLDRTYSILKGSENFFRKINIHIIQCDNEVQSDTKITNDEEFDTFMQYGKIRGFGSTDFRPVFDYVERLRAQGEFENLKGLIYFTDGYGIYPSKMPDYDVIFAFLGEDDKIPQVPPWAIKVVLEEEELEEQK